MLDQPVKYIFWDLCFNVAQVILSKAASLCVSLQKKQHCRSHCHIFPTKVVWNTWFKNLKQLIFQLFSKALFLHFFFFYNFFSKFWTSIYVSVFKNSKPCKKRFNNLNVKLHFNMLSFISPPKTPLFPTLNLQRPPMSSLLSKHVGSRPSSRQPLMLVTPEGPAPITATLWTMLAQLADLLQMFAVWKMVEFYVYSMTVSHPLFWSC